MHYFLRIFKCSSKLFDQLYPHINELPYVECSIKIYYDEPHIGQNNTLQPKSSIIYGRYTIPFTLNNYYQKAQLHINPLFDQFINDTKLNVNTSESSELHNSSIKENVDIIYGCDDSKHINKVYIDQTNGISALKVSTVGMSVKAEINHYKRVSKDEIYMYKLPLNYEFLQDLSYKYVLQCKDKHNNRLSHHAMLLEPCNLRELANRMNLKLSNYVGKVYWIAFAETFISLYIRPYMPYQNMINRFMLN